jgi:hypothetical protein
MRGNWTINFTLPIQYDSVRNVLTADTINTFQIASLMDILLDMKVRDSSRGSLSY